MARPGDRDAELGLAPQHRVHHAGGRVVEYADAVVRVAQGVLADDLRQVADAHRGHAGDHQIAALGHPRLADLHERGCELCQHFSRKLLLCKGLPSVKTEGAKPAFRRLFEEVGLPEAIRTDNGVPFASTGIHGLCALNVWWMQLGIVHQRILPASPQENGQHERMHRELERETARPPASNLRGQQRKFDHFQRRYNEERPHDGIDGQVPDERWEPSPRPYPERIAPPEYPSHLEVRRVSAAGTFRLKAKQPFLSNALADQHIGLEEVGDGVWNLVYYRTLLGKIDERTGQITGV
jgi:hypothetical protein